MQKNASVTINQKRERVELDYENLRKVVSVLRAVNHRLRQEIIELLQGRDQITVTDIYVQLRIEQSVASQHLAILRRAEIVNTTREGKYICYSLNKAKLAVISKLASKLG